MGHFRDRFAVFCGNAFTFANFMMILARIVNIILTTAMILCFIINEINIIVMGFYSMEIHNASIYFTLFNICLILFRVMMTLIEKEYDIRYLFLAIQEFFLAVIFGLVSLCIIYGLLMPIDGIRNKVLGTVIFNIALHIFYLRSKTLHGWKDL